LLLLLLLLPCVCWLLQATGREKDCIDTYKWLEDNHPIPKVKKQVGGCGCKQGINRRHVAGVDLYVRFQCLPSMYYTYAYGWLCCLLW
jgi:hypothetical protein